jgi:hypothetical protein
VSTGSSESKVSIVTLSSDDIGHLASAPIEMVPAQGPGTVIVVERAAFQNVPGAVSFGDHVITTLGYDGGDNLDANVDIARDDSTFVAVLMPFDGRPDTADVEDAAIVLLSDVDLADSGPIATTALNDGGLGYEVGDTFIIGDHGATGEVASVAVGVVVTYTITDPGNGYAVEDGVTTSATSGIGEGLLIDILTVDANPGDGTAVVTVWYSVLRLA